MKLVIERFLHNALALLAVITILFFMFRLMPGYAAGRLHQRQPERGPAEGDAAAVRPRSADVAAIPDLPRQPRARRDGPVVLPAPAGRRDPARGAAELADPDAGSLSSPTCSACWPARGSPGSAAAGSSAPPMPVVLATRAAPEFWIGMVLLALLSFKLGWFPSGGASSPGEAYTSNWQRIFSLDYLQHLALPVAHAGPLSAGPAAAADALQHARGDARGVRHHGAHEGPVANGASSSATPRATRCCRW